jgi:nucleotide-binding universal stress UspA family protein
MAARLAGLLAGAHGMPVTILSIDAHAQSSGRPADRADLMEKHVKEGAKKSAAKVIADTAEPDPEKVHLTTRVTANTPVDSVKEEARKGYDLMVIGMENSMKADGGFVPKVTRLAEEFRGPLMVLVHSGKTEMPLSARSRILVPVNGSPVSREAAEVAFALARGTGARVHVLFVSKTDARSRTRVREEGVLKDIASLGERYNISAATRISSRGEAAEAILKEAKRDYAMMVMGANARPGEGLFFGSTATAVLKGWDNPILLLAS